MNWTEKERRIFKHIGLDDKDAFADPLKVRRGLLLASGGHIDDWWEAVCQPKTFEDGNLNPAYQPLKIAELEGKVCNAVRAAFDLKPVDPATGTGAMDSYCLYLMEAFLDWYEKKSENPSVTPNSSLFTDGLRGPDPAIMRGTLDSFSMPDAYAAGKPTR